MTQAAGTAPARSKDEELFRSDLIKVLEKELAADMSRLELSLGQQVKILTDLTVGIRGNTFEPRFNFLEQDVVIFRVASVAPQLESYFRMTSDSDTLRLPHLIIEVKYRGINSHSLMTYTNIANRIKSIFGSTKYYLLLRYDNKSSETLLRHGGGFDRIVQLETIRGTQTTKRYQVGSFLKDLQSDDRLRLKFDMFMKTLRRDLSDSKIV